MVVVSYMVTIGVDASYTVEVQANSPESAVEKARKSGPGGLCHYCSENFELETSAEQYVFVMDEAGRILFKDDGDTQDRYRPHDSDR